ncbi:MAG: hypothetical protein ABIL58_07070 [Pseudomonadota bacterium]
MSSTTFPSSVKAITYPQGLGTGHRKRGSRKVSFRKKGLSANVPTVELRGLMKPSHIFPSWQQKRHHEVISSLQAEIDRHAQVSSFRRLLLGSAYYDIRDYEKLSATVVLLEKKIAGCDERYHTLDLSAFPSILRGLATLDQKDYDLAISQASRAFDELNRPSSKVNAGYNTQMIDTAGILGVAYAALGQHEPMARAWARWPPSTPRAASTVRKSSSPSPGSPLGAAAVPKRHRGRIAPGRESVSHNAECRPGDAQRLRNCAGQDHEGR